MSMITEKMNQNYKLTGKKAFYLLDTKKLQENIENFKNDFYEILGKNNVIIGYSFKTNNHRYVIDEVKKANLYAEVVSDEEYKLAVKRGYKKSKIIYNGVYPDKKNKLKVIRNNGIVNIESENELVDILKSAKKHECLNIGLRINFKTYYTSRFGVEYKSDEYYRILDMQKKGLIRIKGLHIHSYGGRDYETWTRKALFITKIARELDVEYIDFGSNMYGYMDSRLEKQFENPLKPKDYANIIHKTLMYVYGFGKKPKVIVEPATPIVADAISLVCNVINKRKIDDKNIITVNASKYDLGFLVETKNVPIDIITTSKTNEDGIVYGYTCTEGDVMSSSCMCSIGDILIFRNIGAYGYSVANNFIKNRLDMKKNID